MENSDQKKKHLLSSKNDPLKTNIHLNNINFNNNELEKINNSNNSNITIEKVLSYEIDAIKKDTIVLTDIDNSFNKENKENKKNSDNKSLNKNTILEINNNISNNKIIENSIVKFKNDVNNKEIHSSNSHIKSEKEINLHKNNINNNKIKEPNESIYNSNEFFDINISQNNNKSNKISQENIFNKNSPENNKENDKFQINEDSIKKLQNIKNILFNDGSSNIYIGLCNKEYFKNKINSNDFKLTDFKVENVIGDGNCGFRSLSLQLYNNQENHNIVRAHIFNFLNNNIEYYSNNYMIYTILT